jgi:hypothetical protein
MNFQEDYAIGNGYCSGQGGGGLIVGGGDLGDGEEERRVMMKKMMLLYTNLTALLIICKEQLIFKMCCNWQECISALPLETVGKESLKSLIQDLNMSVVCVGNSKSGYH